MNIELTKFTIFAVIERLMITLVGFVSTIIIGRLGAIELASVSIATNIINIMQSIFIALGLGYTVYIAINSKQRNKATFNALAVSTIFAVALFLITIFFMPQIINLLFASSNPQIRTCAVKYLGVIKWVLIPLGIDITISSCLKGALNSKTPMIITFLSNILNICFCILFIIVLDLGYIGGAYAFVCSTLISALIKLMVILFPLSEIRIAKLYKIDLMCIRKFFKTGLPSIVGQLLIQCGFLGLQVVTALLGTMVLNGYQICANVLNIVYAITAGVEVSETSFVSRYVSLGDEVLAKKTAYGLTNLITRCMFVVAALIFIFSKNIASIFSQNNYVIVTASKYIRLMCFTIPFTTYFQCIQGTLKTCEDIKFVACVTAICTWGVKILMSYVFVKFFKLGFYGLFIGFMMDYVLRAVLFGIQARKENWLHCKK